MHVLRLASLRRGLLAIKSPCPNQEQGLNLVSKLLFRLGKVTEPLLDGQLSGVHQLVCRRQGLRFLVLSLPLLSVLHQLVSQCQGLRFLVLSLPLLSVLHLLVAYGILYLPNDARRVLDTKAVLPSGGYDPNPSNGYGIHRSVSDGILGASRGCSQGV